MDHIKDYLRQLKAALDALDLEAVRRARDWVGQTRQEGRQLFLCGNGGSAATASHLANDLGKGASYGRSSRFRVIALTDNLPWITALANDVGYEAIFAEQLRNLGQQGDLLIAISGSGNSPNVLNAVRVAGELGMLSIGWCGFGGGKLVEMVDLPVVVDSRHMGRVEDVHAILMHLICYYFMERES
ncbi:MAG: SIS domain-containing protein [Candidatus Handelsmanbacteria bacterium]|nr:SIS domain-containing protein [Candidatus Handelsmanbacteria bacterium]